MAAGHAERQKEESLAAAVAWLSCGSVCCDERLVRCRWPSRGGSGAWSVIAESERRESGVWRVSRERKQKPTMDTDTVMRWTRRLVTL